MDISFTDVLRGQTDHILDACTRCGKCAEACPMTEPAGVDTSDAPALVSGVLDLLRGGEGTPGAERWATVCSNSGKCIPACSYGINPRLMMNLARIAAKGIAAPTTAPPIKAAVPASAAPPIMCDKPRAPINGIPGIM